MTIETAMTTSVNGTSSPVAPDLQSQSAAKKVAVAVAVRDATKWLHKTKLCVYSIQGQCRLGSKCSFAHSATEVQDAPNLFKTQLCEAFAEGKCNDPDCSFAHGEEELRLSPNFKNKMCKWFSKGKCRNGSDCGFAHGTEELRNPKSIDLFLLPETGEIPPPPGLSLLMEEADKKERRILDLEASLLDEKAPPTLEQQVEGMSATIAALQWKMDEMVLRTQVSGMKQFLGQLSAQCAELEHAVSKTGEPSSTTTTVAKTPDVKTPLKTPLSSKATPFQPTALSSKASVFVPSYPTGYESADTYWPSDESTSTGSGGGYSSD